MTLAKFKASVQPLLDARDEVANLEGQRPVSLNKRAAADQDTNDTILMVVNAINRDPQSRRGQRVVRRDELRPQE